MQFPQSRTALPRVSIIEADSLAAIDPSGGARDAANGYDAADALADWPDLGALRKAAASLAKPFDPGLAYVSFPAFTTDAGGLVIVIERGRGRDEAN